MVGSIQCYFTANKVKPSLIFILPCAEFAYENLWKEDFMAPCNKTHSPIQHLCEMKQNRERADNPHKPTLTGYSLLQTCICKIRFPI